jgi:DNA polymerase III subunit gamma/tau
MPYVALARTWRPKTFAELIGQEHVTKALTNSLARERVHHAYLFTGTRGVGKTSVARLLAKALNCEQGISPEPCLTCDTCLAVEQGRYIDLIEIDAASKTRVEDTRELLENVTYAPTQGRFKIYLIDEVHMLSTHSFNALLKTLEEPPPHVKFLLATTEPQKLPMTVLSRCLQFHLKALKTTCISAHLERILTQENITFESDALKLIAAAATGSMRDALSLLDQIIAHADGAIQATAVKQALGYTQLDYALTILQSLAKHDAPSLITLSHAIAAEGGHYTYVLRELLTHLHQLSLLYIQPKQTQPKTELTPLLQQFSPEDTQLLYQIALKGLDELSLAPTHAIGFEMTLLRMHTFRPIKTVSPPPLAYTQTTPPESKPELKPEPKQPEQPLQQAKPQLSNTSEAKSVAWQDIIPELKLTGLALNAARHAELVLHPNDKAELCITHQNTPLFTPNVLKKIETRLSEYYDKNINVTLTQTANQPDSPAEKTRLLKQAEQQKHEATLRADTSFQHLKEIFHPNE